MKLRKRGYLETYNTRDSIFQQKEEHLLKQINPKSAYRRDYYNFEPCFFHSCATKSSSAYQSSPNLRTSASLTNL